MRRNVGIRLPSKHSPISIHRPTPIYITVTAPFPSKQAHDGRFFCFKPHYTHRDGTRDQQKQLWTDRCRNVHFPVTPNTLHSLNPGPISQMWWELCEPENISKCQNNALQSSDGGNLREWDHFGDLGADGRIILKWILENRMGGVEWTDLAQDRDKWRALVNTLMNLWVP